jgi:adenylate cyclase
VDIHEISTRLNVKSILEGSVRKAGNRIRVSTQLINAEDGYHLWSERYDREMTDVFAMQDEICQAIVDTLRIELAVGGKLVKPHTNNVESYNLFLKGRYQLQRLTQEGFDKSKAHLEQAIKLDPMYALAWNGLATNYWFRGYLGFMPVKEANAQCSQATIKALELDEMLAEAHSLRAMLQASEFDWKEAQREFGRALELNSDSADVWANYSQFYLVPVRRLEEAVTAAQKALKLDPLSAHIHWHLGSRYYLMRRYGQAIEQFRNALELDPRWHFAHMDMGFCQIFLGNSEQGIKAVETGARLMQQDSFVLAKLSMAYALVGRIAEAKQISEQLQEIAQKKYVSAFVFGAIYLGLREMDRCFDWMEKSVDEHESMFQYALFDPIVDPFRSHPRYHALLRKMNLEP